MKKLRVCSMLFAMMVLSLTSAVGQPAKIVFSLSPSLTAPERAEFRANAMAGIGTGQPVGTGVAQFMPLTTNYLAPWNVITYTNSRPRLEAGLVVTTNTSLSRWSYRITSSDTNANQPKGSIAFEGALGSVYSSLRKGSQFGADRKEGGGDDVPLVASEPATTQADKIVFIGFGVTYERSTAAEAAAVQKYLVDNNVVVTFEYLQDGMVMVRESIRFTPPPVVTPPAPLLTASATPTTIAEGASSVLSWFTTNATNVTLQGESVSPVGTRTVSPSATTNYVIVAMGVGNVSTQSVLNVTVTPRPRPPTPTVSMGVAPQEIYVGDSVTIGWNTTGATNVILSEVGETDLSGSAIIKPAKTTTYTVTAMGPGGVVTGSATVTVSVRPIVPIYELESEGVLSLGGPVTKGQALQLNGSVRSMGPDAYPGSITNWWQLQIQSIGGETRTDWKDWQSAGVITGLAVGESKQVEPYSWVAGEPDPSVRYVFRLRSVTSSGEWFSQEEVRVLPTPPPALLRGGRLTIVTLEGASAGQYMLQRLTSSGGWENLTTASLTGGILGFVVPQGTNTSGIFRTVQVPAP